MVPTEDEIEGALKHLRRKGRAPERVARGVEEEEERGGRGRGREDGRRGRGIGGDQLGEVSGPGTDGVQGGKTDGGGHVTGSGSDP